MAVRSLTTVFPVSGVYSLRAACPCAATADTFITEHPAYGATSNHGAGASLTAIGAPGYLSYPLLRFDLAALSGSMVSNTPRLQLYLTGGHTGSESVPRAVSLHEVLVPWTGNSVHWDNFGGQPGVQTGPNISSGLAAANVDWANGQPGFYAWDLPAALVQKWIDHPEENFGLLLNNQVTAFQRDIGFASLENGIYPIPRLELTLIPGTGPTPLQRWRQTHFGASDANELRANDADFDDDAVPNLVEYFAGTNPAIAESATNPPTGLAVLPPASPQALVECRAILSNAALCDPTVRLSLQHSSSLHGEWITLSSRTGSGTWSGPAPVLEVGSTRSTHHFSTGLGLPQATGKLFLRLLLEELP